MTTHRLSAADARRITVRAQLLDARRPTDMVEIIRHLGFLPVNSTATVAPAADLILWTRLGSAYDRRDLADALEMRQLIDLRGFIRPSEDIALFRDDMEQWPGPDASEWRQDVAEWLEDNDYCHQDILERLRADGPLPIRDLPDTCEVPWRSSGWNNNQNVTQLIQILVAKGEVASAGWDGRFRLWDLASRVYLDEPIVPSAEAALIRNRRRLRAMGIARVKAAEQQVEPIDVGAEVGEPAVVEGVRGTWRVDPEALDQPFTGRAALLSPYDRIVQDRRHASDLFGFEFEVGMYKPVAKRRWGYFPLPILYDDQLVGKLDAEADRANGVLQINAIHQDVTFTKTMESAINDEIEDLARWLGLKVAKPA